MSAVPVACFCEEEGDAAADAWGFNCGPAALCAVLGLKPEEIRPHLLDFEKRGYTNPTLMDQVLDKLRVGRELVYRSDAGFLHALTTMEGKWPDLGLMRVQWGGRWTREGVPMRARYRYTHWVGTRMREGRDEWFDVNYLHYGGWMPVVEWMADLAPWMMEQFCKPGGNGEWWPTHVIRLTEPLPDFSRLKQET